MTTTVTTHSTSVRVSKNGTMTTLASDLSGDSMSMAHQAQMSLPSSLISVSGLLNSRNLVQDEKLVVATLATLDSGNVSNLIKQDLKLSIQSRRKAEGKAEIQVEFKKPVRDEQLTSEELIKRARRRELNRLAARRSREKGQKRKDMLVEEIHKLQSENSELINLLGDLTEERNTIIETLRQHMKQCSDYHATQSAAVGMSQRVLDLLGFPSLGSSQTDLPGVSNLYISTGDLSSTPPQSHSPSVTIKTESFPYSSCPSSPMVVGLSGKIINVEDSALPLSSKRIGSDETSSVLGSSIYDSCSPLTGYSTPLASPQLASFESPTLPATRPPLPPRRSSTQGLERSDTMSSTATEQESNYSPDEDEVPHYKHKLMKYRNQSSDFSRPSDVCVRGARVSLERSFSFPCTGRESRSSKGLGSPRSIMGESVHSGNSVDFQGISTTASASVDTGSEGESYDSPLDLAVRRNKGNFATDSDEKHFGVSPMDTWPPAGSRSGLGTASRGLERRWSVDDRHSLSQPLPQPLNLSSKETVEEEDLDLSQTSTGSSSPSLQKNSKYSRYTVDPYS